MFNRKGISLVELIVVTAGLAGVALVGMQISKNLFKTTSKSNFDSETLLINNEINAILSDTAKCFTALGGKNALSTTTGINSINNKFFSAASGSAPSSGYGNANLTIQNYALEATATNISANNSFLLINFQNKQILKGNSGPSTITKKVNLHVEVDGSNNIVKCRSLSSSSSDIWTRGIGADIFYTGGKIGIGTNSPQATLDIAGGIKLGSETDVTVCDANTEGTQRFNKTSHQIEHCGYNAGPPARYSWYRVVSEEITANYTYFQPSVSCASGGTEGNTDYSIPHSTCTGVNNGTRYYSSGYSTGNCNALNGCNWTVQCTSNRIASVVDFSCTND